MIDEIKDIGNIPEFYSTQVLSASRFYLDTQGCKHPDLTVVCGGSEQCEPDFCIDRTDFPFYSIEYVARGKGTLTLNGKSHALNIGTVFVYGPEIAHKIVTHDQDHLVKYFVDFTGKQVEILLTEHHLAPGEVCHVSSPDHILRIFDDLIGNGQTGSPYAPAICATLVRYLILKIAETAVDHDVIHTAAFATYQTCRERIQRDFLNLKSLSQIASTCHVDEAYLCRLFQRFDKQSPYQFLMRLKMNAAAQQLQQSTALIKEVAYAFGFTSPFHFSRAFKKVFGISPDAFRRLR